MPKFHLPAHGPTCQVRYSFNYTHGVGRTHGETVEQEWAYINLAALSTREMGPGARHSALDDSWGGWNWRKTLGLGEHNVSFYTPISCRYSDDHVQGHYLRRTSEKRSKWHQNNAKPLMSFLRHFPTRLSGFGERWWMIGKRIHYALTRMSPVNMVSFVGGLKAIAHQRQHFY